MVRCWSFSRVSHRGSDTIGALSVQHFEKCPLYARPKQAPLGHPSPAREGEDERTFGAPEKVAAANMLVPIQT